MCRVFFLCEFKKKNLIVVNFEKNNLKLAIRINNTHSFDQLVKAVNINDSLVSFIHSNSNIVIHFYLFRSMFVKLFKNKFNNTFRHSIKLQKRYIQSLELL